MFKIISVVVAFIVNVTVTGPWFVGQVLGFSVEHDGFWDYFWPCLGCMMVVAVFLYLIGSIIDSEIEN